MAVHFTCDVCGVELEKSANGTVFEQDNARVKVMTAIDGTWNAGHICVSCIVNTVLNGGVIQEGVTRLEYQMPHSIVRSSNDIDDAGMVEVEDLPLGGKLIIDDDVRAMRDEENSGNYGRYTTTNGI